MTFEQAVKALAMTDPWTDDRLDPETLIEILKDDVVQAARRPGSWEGVNMRQVLTAHGFLNGY